jgi:hypothetical protein
MATGGTWDCLPEEIVSLITVKVAETLEDPLEGLHSLRLCNKAMKRTTSSRTIFNRFNLVHHYQSEVSLGGGGCADALNDTSELSTGCKVQTMEEPSSSRGWPTYEQADPVVWHSSHEQKRKETYKHHMCCPYSSTTSTVQLTMF